MASSERVGDLEEWDAHKVTLQLRRSPIEVVMLWIVAGIMGFVSMASTMVGVLLAFEGSLMVGAAMMLLPAGVTAALAAGAVLASWWHVRVNAIRVEIGSDRLRIAGREFLLADVVDFRWQLGWFVVRMRDGTVYRSPELAPREPERLVELIRDAVPTRESLEAGRADPVAARQLGELLTTLER